MQVESSAVTMSATHALTESHEVSEQLQIRRPASSGGSSSKATGPPGPGAYVDSRTMLMAWVFEFLTGKRAHIFRPPNLPAAAPAGVSAAASAPSWGVSYSRREVDQEQESTNFTAQGTVTLQSGQQVSFALNLSMNRDQTEIQSLSFNAGNMSDPIALNFDGLGVRLSGQKTEFDLNGDGVNELVATLASGSAWLAQDKNGNGTIDNGQELFGPSSGNGFAELAQLDTDHNGWIDAGDSAYNQLGLWQGNQFTSLADAGIGAISVASASTPFALKEGAQVLGEVERSGVYLSDQGQPGVVQQVDLSV